MTEFAIDLTDEFAASANGQPSDETLPLSVATEGEVQLPRVDPARGVFITSDGNEIQLSDKPVNALIAQRLNQEGKPKIPMVEVTLLGKHKQLEAHPHDEGYLARLAEWREEAEIRVGTYMFNLGVKGQPPQDFVDEHAPLFPSATQSELKYLWVLSQLPYQDITAFSEALISRATPTTKGLDEVAESFRGDDKRQSD